jgi:hypothetical protein
MTSSPVPDPVERFVTVVTNGEDPISEEQRLRVCDWLRANGITPKSVSAQHPITIEGRLHTGRKRHQVICFSEYHLDDTGHRYADPRDNNTAMVFQRAVRQVAELAPDPAFAKEPTS